MAASGGDCSTDLRVLHGLLDRSFFKPSTPPPRKSVNLWTTGGEVEPGDAATIKLGGTVLRCAPAHDEATQRNEQKCALCKKPFLAKDEAQHRESKCHVAASLKVFDGVDALTGPSGTVTTRMLEHLVGGEPAPPTRQNSPPRRNPPPPTAAFLPTSGPSGKRSRGEEMVRAVQNLPRDGGAGR